MQSSVQQPLNKRPVRFPLQMGFTQVVPAWASAGWCERVLPMLPVSQTHPHPQPAWQPQVGSLARSSAALTTAYSISRSEHIYTCPDPSASRTACTLQGGPQIQFSIQCVHAPHNSTPCLSWLNSLLSKCSFLVVCNKTFYIQKDQVSVRRLRSH